MGLWFWFLGAGALAGGGVAGGTATVAGGTVAAGSITATQVATGVAIAVAVTIPGDTPKEGTKTAEELSKAHGIAASVQDRTAVGYGGNCTPEEHDKLKQKQVEACNKAKGITCEKNEINIDKYYLLDACAQARINIAKRCFAGGDKGHNKQINQMKQGAAQCWNEG